MYLSAIFAVFVGASTALGLSRVFLPPSPKSVGLARGLRAASAWRGMSRRRIHVIGPLPAIPLAGHQVDR